MIEVVSVASAVSFSVGVFVGVCFTSRKGGGSSDSLRQTAEMLRLVVDLSRSIKEHVDDE